MLIFFFFDTEPVSSLPLVLRYSHCPCERIGIMVEEMMTKPLKKAMKGKRNTSNTDIHFSVTKGTAKAID